MKSILDVGILNNELIERNVAQGEFKTARLNFCDPTITW